MRSFSAVEEGGTRPTSGGNSNVIRLTPEQQAAARLFGMSDIDYAKQLRAMGKA